MENTLFKNKNFVTASIVFMVVLIVFVGMLALSAIKQFQYIGVDVPVTNTVSVSGEGEVFITPDIAKITFGVREEAATVEQAQTLATERMNKALAVLEEHGIAEKDIKGTGYSISSRYEYEQERFICTTFPCPQPPSRRVLAGYTVSQTVNVTVRDIDDAGSVLGDLGALGVQEVSGLHFTVDDPEAAQAEARAAAIEDAQEKAKILARDLGVNLVRIVNFWEDRSYPVGFGGDFALNRAASPAADSEEGFIAPTIPAGENRIVSNVNITYQIK